jgi:microcystin-dependent protein
MSFGNGVGLDPVSLGQVSGTENVTLNISQLPQHNHFCMATSAAASTKSPTGGVLASFGMYNTAPPDAAAGNMSAATIANSGGGQSHPNQQPYLVVNWIIALVGIFPSRN